MLNFNFVFFQGSPKTHPEVEAMEATVSIPQGAAGGAFSFDETSSLMNHQSSLLSGKDNYCYKCQYFSLVTSSKKVFLF